jgi:drug/metabolite transporter (DMT)-like permease
MRAYSTADIHETFTFMVDDWRVASLFIQGSSGLLATATNWKFQLVALLMGFAYYLELISWFTVVKYIDVSKRASITAPAPAVTVLLALVLLGQELHDYQITALVLVVGSVVGHIRYGRKEKSAG